MGQRREGRALPARSDRQIIGHEHTMALLEAVASGRITRSGAAANAAFLLDDMPVALRALAREDLIFAPFGGSVPPSLASRGARLLAVWRGELPMPLEQ
jgi:hypothetical protein